MTTKTPSTTDHNPNVDGTVASVLSRRKFLSTAVASVAAGGLANFAGAEQADLGVQDKVELPQLHAQSESAEKTPGPFENPSARVGYAIVGLGHLSLNQILPGFARCKYSKPVALVSGDSSKAHKIADQYGIPKDSIYNYENYEELAHNPSVQAIYIVLPNSMHADFVVRGAKAGKHILCEKPMATSVNDCQRMIAACNAAGVKLMIAYRQQYEPMNRALVKLVRDGKLGELRTIIATNAQNQGDPSQWRQKIKLAGGGCLPDVGIYCLNAARFISGQEPVEVSGMTWQPKDDPRFAEVEATCTFELKFPSGLIAVCNSGYAVHRSQFLRVEGDKGWAELSPAFGYTGLRLRTSWTEDGHDTVREPSIEAMDQFATEIDHMSLCIQQKSPVYTPGEEGLQDQTIVEAIYASAKAGRTIKVAPPKGPTRGTVLAEAES